METALSTPSPTRRVEPLVHADLRAALAVRLLGLQSITVRGGRGRRGDPLRGLDERTRSGSTRSRARSSRAAWRRDRDRDARVSEAAVPGRSPGSSHRPDAPCAARIRLSRRVLLPLRLIPGFRRATRPAPGSWRPRARLDPFRASAFLIEDELAETGEVVACATVFLTNRECPWHCLMCDLWLSTLQESVRPGRFPSTGGPTEGRVQRIKLYNAGMLLRPEGDPSRRIREHRRPPRPVRARDGGESSRSRRGPLFRVSRAPGRTARSGYRAGDDPPRPEQDLEGFRRRPTHLTVTGSGSAPSCWSASRCHAGRVRRGAAVRSSSRSIAGRSCRSSPRGRATECLARSRRPG